MIIGLLFSINIGALADDWIDAIDRGDMLLNSNNMDEAIKQYEEALSIGIKSSQAKHCVSVSKLGYCYFKFGDYGKALEYFQTGRNLSRSYFGTMHQCYTNALNNLAAVDHFLGRYAEADMILREVIDIKKKMFGESDTSYAISLYNLGMLLKTMGNYKDAEQVLLKSQSIKIQANPVDKSSLINGYLGLASLYMNLGNNDLAGDYAREAQKIIKASKSINKQLSNAVNIMIACIHINQGKIDEVENSLSSKEIESIASDNFDPDLPYNLFNLGIMKYKQRKYTDAEKLFNQSKTLTEKQFGKTSYLYLANLNALGINCWLQGQNNPALKFMNQAAVISEMFFGEKHPEYADALFNLAGMQSDLNYNDLAEQNFKKAIEITNEMIHNTLPFLSESEKEKFYFDLREKMELFINFVFTHYDRNKSLAEDLLDFEIHTKSILLKSQIEQRRNIISSSDENIRNIFDEWVRSRDIISSMFLLSKNESINSMINLDSLKKEVNKYEKILSEKLSINIDKKDEFDSKTILSKLETNECLVDILKFNLRLKSNAGPAYLALLAMPSKPVELVTLDVDNKYESTFIKNYNRSIKNRIPDKDSYGAFWEQIDKEISDYKKIYFSPDGVYNNINLYTLLTPDNKYLIEKRDIRILNNPADIMNKPNVIGFKNMALYGKPDYQVDLNEANPKAAFPGFSRFKSIKLNPLPGTEAEINNIDKLSKNSGLPATVYLDRQSTKNRFLSDQSNILHVATHGFFLNDNLNSGQELNRKSIAFNPMMNSGLFFAGAQVSIDKNYSSTGDNGILSAYDVMNSNMSGAGLVVLSACETGLGEIINGEGVYGLKRAFQIAGAKNLILSLWKVDDKATLELMTEFYTNLFDTKDVNESLRRAQLKLKTKYPDPYYWGGFICVNN